jgi:thiamine-phosphate pyrophosphorylase
LGINRLHFTEARRKELIAEKLIRMKETNTILSTSIHQTQEYQELSSCFDYTFFGPVFDSVSKPGYTSSLAADFIFPVRAHHPKPIALGGIEAATIQKARKMQFSGVAALGTIWKNPAESIKQFKALQKAWKQTGLL